MNPKSLQDFCSDILPTIGRAVSGDRILADVTSVVATDRWNSFDRFHETTETLIGSYRNAGADTEVHAIPTGGSVNTGRWVIKEASDIRGATVDIVSPIRQRLLDYRDNPWHLIQWSLATSPGGVTGELVLVDTPSELARWSDGGLAGKVILSQLDPRTILKQLSDSGALAVITDNGQTGLPDATPWTKFGWGQIPNTEGSRGMVGLVLSVTAGARLRELHRNQRPVSLHIEVDLTKYEGTHDVVSGIVHGRDDPQDEVWVLAHSAEPGAVDNASGVSVCLEMARVIETMIQDGVVPRPRRSIRFLNGYECYGFFHYMEHVPRLQTPLAGLCLDTLGTKPEYCDGRISWQATIPMSAGFVDRIGEQLLRSTLELINPGYTLHTGGFIATSDTLAGDPQYGFPCPWLNTHYLDEGVYKAYHSSADTVDLLSAEGLAVCATAMAGYLLYLADMASEEVVELAAMETELALADLKGRPGHHGTYTKPSVDTVRGTGSSSRSAEDRLTPSEAAYLTSAHTVSLNHLKRWLWGGNRDAVLTYIDEAQKRVATAVAPYCAVEPEPGEDHRIPYRTAFLSPSLANTDVHSGRISEAALPDWALFWADGRRSVAEITNALSVELRKEVDQQDVATYFEGLASLGYVRLVESEKQVSKEQIVRDLGGLGVTKGMDVMVHSSLASIGFVCGGADTVVDALLECIGETGTLLTPSFNHRAAAIFNPMTTPTTNGAIPNTLWRRSNAHRSLHATHSVSGIGARAGEYCRADHVDVGIWAPESPIGRLVHGGGYLLSIGVTHNFTTAYHVAETSVPCRCIDPFGNRDFVVDDGEVREVAGLAFREGTCPVDPEWLHGPLQQRGVESEGLVGDARSTLVKALDLWKVRREQLKDVCPTCVVRPRFRS